MPFDGNATGAISEAVRSDRFVLGPASGGVATSSIGRRFTVQHLPVVSIYAIQGAGPGGVILRVWADRQGSPFVLDTIALPGVIATSMTIREYPNLVVNNLFVDLVVAPSNPLGVLTDEEVTVTLFASAKAARAVSAMARPSFS